MIRPLREEDQAAWLPLWEGYLAFYKASVTPEVTQTNFARLLDPAEPMHAALAFESERAVGLVHWIFHRSTWTIGDYCYLQDLFVSPETRGNGTGRALIEHVAETARQAGASRLYWLTHESNHDAMKLYDKIAERSGFLQYRRIFG